jgi:Mor family transcriptional regulator
MSAQPDNYPELLTHLMKISSEAMTKRGMDQEVAHNASFEIAEAVRMQWGGAILYLPKGKEFMITQRDLQIYEAFNGHNIRLLAQKHHLTDAQVYKIIQRVRAADLKRRQVDAFTSGE